MARFRATIRGQKKEVSRLGSSNSGISGEINGWNLGVWVGGGVERGQDDINFLAPDSFTVRRTGGTNRVVHTSFSVRFEEGKDDVYCHFAGRIFHFFINPVGVPQCIQEAGGYVHDE